MYKFKCIFQTDQDSTLNTQNSNMVFQEHGYSTLYEELPSKYTDDTSDHSYSIKRNTPSRPDKKSGYHLIIDNLDCEIKVRNMTVDHQNQSKHYVQVCKVYTSMYASLYVKQLSDHVSDRRVIRTHSIIMCIA